LFLLALVEWLAAGSHPAGISALALLALVSVAHGGQSIWALRIHQTTSYFTGTLITTINAAVLANADIGTRCVSSAPCWLGPSWSAWSCSPAPGNTGRTAASADRSRRRKRPHRAAGRQTPPPNTKAHGRYALDPTE
jgi:hypothetical protein